jgi:hypothetical protein
MPAGLPALGHNDVDASIHRTTGLGRTGDRVHDQGPGAMDARNVWGGIIPEEGHDGHTDLEADVELFIDCRNVHLPPHKKIHPEGAVGQPAGFVSDLAHLLLVAIGQPQHAEPARIGDCGDEGGRGESAHGSLDDG